MTQFINKPFIAHLPQTPLKPRRPPTIQVSASGSVTLGSSPTVIPLDTIEIDDLGIWNPALAPKIYLPSGISWIRAIGFAGVSNSNVGNNTCYFGVHKNGLEAAAVNMYETNQPTLVFETPWISAKPGDYLTLAMSSALGGTYTTSTTYPARLMVEMSEG
jgi:hypothetical protein